MHTNLACCMPPCTCLMCKQTCIQVPTLHPHSSHSSLHLSTLGCRTCLHRSSLLLHTPTLLDHRSLLFSILIRAHKRCIHPLRPSGLPIGRGGYRHATAERAYGKQSVRAACMPSCMSCVLPAMHVCCVCCMHVVLHVVHAACDAGVLSMLHLHSEELILLHVVHAACDACV